MSARLFNKEKGLYAHGWSGSNQDAPRFYWGRATGWIVVAMCDLLDVLPKDHPGYPKVMAQLRRLDEKQTLNARIAARADGAPTQLADVLRDERVSTIADGDRVEYRAVVVDGTYDVAAEFTVPNRTLDGAPGRMVVTPLRWSDTEAPILVLRGFIPQAIEDNTAPIEGAEPLSNRAMFSSGIDPRRPEGTVSPPIACSVDRLATSARRCTSYCSMCRGRARLKQ